MLAQEARTTMPDFTFSTSVPCHCLPQQAPQAHFKWAKHKLLLKQRKTQGSRHYYNPVLRNGQVQVSIFLFHQMYPKLTSSIEEGGGHDKWTDPSIPEMPLALPLWEKAMKQVEKDPSRVKFHVENLGYHVPEPSLMILGGLPEQCHLFMANWLGVQKTWMKWLEEDPPSQHPSSQQWQDFLIRL